MHLYSFFVHSTTDTEVQNNSITTDTESQNDSTFTLIDSNPKNDVNGSENAQLGQNTAVVYLDVKSAPNMIDICDCEATRCCTTTTSLFYHMQHEFFTDPSGTPTKAFFRFCQPNWNVRVINNIRLEERGPGSMYNAVTQRTGISDNNPPTFDTKYSVILYAVTDQPSDLTVPIYSSTKFYGNRQRLTSSYARPLSTEDIIEFKNLFGIQTESSNPLQVFQKFTQKYKQLKTREQWKQLALDVKYKIPPLGTITLPQLKYDIAKHIQSRTRLRTGYSNGQHRTAFTAVVTEGWDKVQEVTYNESEFELMVPPEDYIATPEDTILHQPITMTLWCPKQDSFDSKLIHDIYCNSKRELDEGRSAKDLDLQEVMSQILETIEGKPHLWSWHDNDYFGNRKMFPEGYRELMRLIAKKLYSRSPALFDVLDHLRTRDSTLRMTLYNNPKKIDLFLESYLWNNVQIMGNRGFNAMKTTEYNNEFPLQMFPSVYDHNFEKNNNFKWESYFHYIRVLLLSLQNEETLKVLKKITNGVQYMPHTLSHPRDYVPCTEFWNNKLLVVYMSVNVVKCAKIFAEFMFKATQKERKQDRTIPTYNEAKKPFVLNAVAYNMTADIMQIIEREGVNPNKTVPSPDYFSKETIAKLGYLGIFLKHLPLYAEKIWNTDTITYDYKDLTDLNQTEEDTWMAKDKNGNYQNNMVFYSYSPRVYEDGSFKLTNSTSTERKKKTNLQSDIEDWKNGERSYLTTFKYRPTLKHIWNAMYSATTNLKPLQNVLKEVDLEQQYDPNGQLTNDKFARNIRRKTAELQNEKNQAKETLNSDHRAGKKNIQNSTPLTQEPQINRTTANTRNKRKLISQHQNDEHKKNKNRELKNSTKWNSYLKYMNRTRFY